MKYDARLDSMQDNDILVVVQGKRDLALTKFNNTSKKSKENIENTLGEREPLRV
jgi:hypothetical protein